MLENGAEPSTVTKTVTAIKKESGGAGPLEPLEPNMYIYKPIYVYLLPYDPRVGVIARVQVSVIYIFVSLLLLEK